MSKTRIFCNFGKTPAKEVSINNYKEIFVDLLKENITLEDALDQMYSSLNEKAQKQRNKVLKECKRIIKKQFKDIHKIQILQKMKL